MCLNIRERVLIAIWPNATLVTMRLKERRYICLALACIMVMVGMLVSGLKHELNPLFSIIQTELEARRHARDDLVDCLEVSGLGHRLSGSSGKQRLGGE